MATTKELISASEFMALVQQVETLCASIAKLRIQLAPLQAEMEAANREYQTELKPFTQLYRQLTTKGASIIQPAIQPVEYKPKSEVADFTVREQSSEDNLSISEEDLQKDELVEYLVRVIYPSDLPNQQLLGRLQGMNRDSRFTLADMLEELPTNLLQQVSPDEEGNVAQSQQRLLIWINALTARLNELKRLQANLENSSQFALLQQRRQGEQAWRAYLDRQKQEWQQKIDRLRATEAEHMA